MTTQELDQTPAMTLRLLEEFELEFSKIDVTSIAGLGLAC